MALFGSIDQANNSPKYGAQNISRGSGATAMAANTTALYQNTTSAAFITGQAVGVFGVSNTHLANTGGEYKKINHTGWNLRIAGSGGVESVAVAGGGTGYANSDLIVVSGGGGTTNAAGTLVTNSTGGITSVTITTKGAGFVTTPSVAVTNSTAGATTGSGATFTSTLGGRAGRVQYETLVAGGITDSTNTTVFPV